ncbi:hypothetical protein [Sinorhizobium fredii]|uniref:hypothetical protein n=1 Tax=Rhizobium fredii TaxID=380 RepID=UPI0004ACFA1A|nr:hypothetical protein [Sinorhizobium fredii]
MSEDQIKKLLEGQRRIEKSIYLLTMLVIIILVFTVVLPVLAPLMWHLGWWNILGWPE